MKSFFTVRDTRRGSQSYMERRRGRREKKELHKLPKYRKATPNSAI